MIGEKKTLGRRPRTTPRTFTPLALETRTHIPTADAAHHLCLSEHTLRAWACFENGRIRAHRIPGRQGLLWAVADIKGLLSAEPAPALQTACEHKGHAAEARKWRRLAMAAAAAMEKWREAAKAKDSALMDEARAARDEALRKIDAAAREDAR